MESDSRHLAIYQVAHFNIVEVQRVPGTRRQHELGVKLGPFGTFAADFFWSDSRPRLPCVEKQPGTDYWTRRAR